MKLELLKPDFTKAAELLREIMKAKKPILIRYNNDTDGVTGGLAIARLLSKNGVKFIEHENNSALYSAEDARKDVEELRRLGPQFLVVAIDFGANPESVEALEILHSAGASILIIDHHPHDKRVEALANCFVSPWMVGLDSNYAAGFLSGEVAKLFGIDSSELQALSLLGDRSNLLPEKEKTEARKTASQAIDYVAAYDQLEQSLTHYERMLADAAYAAKLSSQANVKLMEACKRGRAMTRTRKTGKWLLQLVKMDKIVKPGEFPPKGKVVSMLHEELAAKEKVPIVSVGYGEKYITFRANELAKQAGFNASDLIRELRADSPETIASGGGHDKAASLRVKEGFDKIVLDEVLKRLGAGGL